MFSFFKSKYPTGVIAPDYRDPRDYQLAEAQPSVLPLPEEFDLRPKMTSIQRQYYGTCTAHAVDGVKEYLDSIEEHKEIKLSQKFIYYNTKKISGLWQIEGDYLVNAIKSVVKFGAPLEELWPDIKMASWQEYVNHQPPQEVYDKALKYRAKTYWRVDKSLEAWKQAVYQNKAPILVGTAWYSNMFKTEADGKLPLPDLSQKYTGHAVSFVGWTKGKLWFRNSYGKEWGLQGYFYIPEENWSKYNWWDAWIITDLEPIQKLEGWMAINYLKPLEGFKAGTKVQVFAFRLNLRAKPSLKTIPLGTFKKGTEAEILSDEVIKADGYLWQKVKIIQKVDK